MTNRRNYEAELVFMSPNDLIPYARNQKKHPSDQIQKIIADIHANGFDQPITVDKENVIITGHGRTMAAKEMGLEKVPVIVRDDLSEVEVMAKRIADNKLNESEWDDDFLQFEMQTLFQNNELDMSMTGFDEAEIAKLIDVGDVTIEQTIGEGDGVDAEGEQQFLVTVHCEDEGQMQEIYDELKERGLNCTLMR